MLLLMLLLSVQVMLSLLVDGAGDVAAVVGVDVAVVVVVADTSVGGLAGVVAVVGIVDVTSA